jgi:Na+-transporting NADH:ubiquinone oxidoreductase subunit A
MIKIKRGLDLPIAGEPDKAIVDGPAVSKVALIGYDYHGMKPTMAVAVGDVVSKGQLLFTDKKTEGVKYTAPAGGKVVAINRGAKRVFQSLVIEVDEQEQEISFNQYSDEQLAALEADALVNDLVESGLWTSFRTRPFSKVPAPATRPAAIFVTAMDTNPLAADAAAIIAKYKEDFDRGVSVLPKLTDGEVFVCAAPNTVEVAASGAQLKEFAGPHPAGLAGTHISLLKTPSLERVVWSINYQDVIAIGKLLSTGSIWTDRVVSLAGPVVEKPRTITTRVGAALDEITSGELAGDNNRVVSGSVLSGRTAAGPFAFLGRYHAQISCLEEGNFRPFMGWASPGADRFSTKNIYVSQFNKAKKFAFNTNTNGSPRAIVPIGSYEKVMPLDILPTQLLRSLVTFDIELSQQLGSLELDEEDLALCTYVTPSKYEYGPILRENLTRIEKES